MPARKVSPLRPKREAEINQKNFDELNTIKVPITGLRFELAQLQKEGMDEIPLGELLLAIKGLTIKDE